MIECRIGVDFYGKNMGKNKLTVHRLTYMNCIKNPFILNSEMHFSGNFVLYTGSLKQWLYTPEQGEITLLQCLPLPRVGSWSKFLAGLLFITLSYENIKRRKCWVVYWFMFINKVNDENYSKKEDLIFWIVVK